MQMRRLHHRLDHLEPAAMLERWKTRAGGGDLRRVDIGEDDARLGVALGKNAALVIHHERMAVGLPPVFMLAALGGGEHERSRLDRARARSRRDRSCSPPPRAASMKTGGRPTAIRSWWITRAAFLPRATPSRASSSPMSTRRRSPPPARVFHRSSMAAGSR